VTLFSYLVLWLTEKNPLYTLIALALAGFVAAIIFWLMARCKALVAPRPVFPATTHSQKE